MAEYAYIGRWPCGCVTCAHVDKPEYRKDIAKETGRWIRDGMVVERVNISEVRVMLQSCPHQLTPDQQRAERRLNKSQARFELP